MINRSSIHPSGLPKTLLLGTVAGTLGVMPGSASADCASERKTCESSCWASFNSGLAGCYTTRDEQTAVCDSWSYWFTHTYEEIEACRTAAEETWQRCREKDFGAGWCLDACYENWVNCNS